MTDTTDTNNIWQFSSFREKVVFSGGYMTEVNESKRLVIPILKVVRALFRIIPYIGVEPKLLVMKQIITLLFLVCILSCNEEPQKNLDDIIKEELATGEKYNSVFLGFKFGMTKDEMRERFESLLDKGKLYVNDRHYTYDITESNGFTHQCTFEPKFHNDSLYKLIVSATSDKMYASPRLIHGSLALLFMEKYGSPEYEDNSLSTNEECTDYYWIDGNRQIKIICGIDDARIFYEDLSVSMKVEMEEDKKLEREKSKSLSDI